MDKKRWIGKRVLVKPFTICGITLDGFFGTILDIRCWDRPQDGYAIKVADDTGDYRWLHPDEIAVD